MEIYIEKNAYELGKHAASLIADLLNKTIKERGGQEYFYQLELLNLVQLML
jgi:hypothetical protein